MPFRLLQGSTATNTTMPSNFAATATRTSIVYVVHALSTSSRIYSHQYHHAVQLCSNCYSDIHCLRCACPFDFFKDLQPPIPPCRPTLQQLLLGHPLSTLCMPFRLLQGSTATNTTMPSNFAATATR